MHGCPCHPDPLSPTARPPVDGDEREREQLARLAPAERALLAAIGSGMGDAEIAAAAGLPPERVAAAVARLLAALGVASRLQAVILAVRHGLIRFDADS